MAQENKYNSIQQHEPLRTPSDWSSQGKRFIAQLEEILDDIYRRFNRLRLKDLDKSLQETIVESEEGVASLTVDVGGIKTEVQDARGTYSTLKQRADSIETEVHDARGNSSTLKQRVDSIASSVSDAEGNISNLRQTANDLTTEVHDARGNSSTLKQRVDGIATAVSNAEGDISDIQQQADSIELTVGKLNINGSNLILGGDKEYSGTSYNLAEWPYFQELIPDETYTFTVCMTPAPQADVPNYRLFTSAGTGSVGRLYPSGTDKQVLSLTFKFMTAGYTGTNHVLRLYRGENVTTTASTTIHWAKLEKGKQTSDAYTPPPNGSDNLLYDSNAQMVASDSSDRWFGDWQCDDMVVGETYTFTACIKPGSDHTSFSLNVHGGGELVNVISYISGTGKQVVSGTFVFAGYSNANRLIACWRRPATVTTAGTVYWAKLCKGVNREAWSPNPNEINNSSIKITNQGIDILTDGKLNMSGQTEGSLLLPNGTVNALNGNFTNLSIGGQKIGAGTFLMPVLCKFTQGQSSAPSGHGFLWFNASGTSYSTASRSGTTDVGYLPRTYTLQAPSNTLTSGTFTYTLTFGVVNRQNSNPNSISFAVTATVGGVTFTSSTITLSKWQTQAVSITVTSTTNLFANTNTLSVEFTSNWSGTSGLGPDLDGSGMTLTAQKSGTSGTQDVTIKYVP